MYVPEHFKEEGADRLETLIQAYSFGVLVSVHEGLPIASHLPFLYDRHVGKNGRLIGHMARGNPQWKSLADGQTVLAIFQGPHAYISPAWYESPGVPTWNYAVAHLYGKATLVEDQHALEKVVQRLTAFHEQDDREAGAPGVSPEIWSRLLGMIVGFEIEVTEIQGKFKLNQNRSREDQRRVAETLARGGSESATALARLMTANLERTP
jgi:transcriptional regulator